MATFLIRPTTTIGIQPQTFLYLILSRTLQVQHRHLLRLVWAVASGTQTVLISKSPVTTTMKQNMGSSPGWWRSSDLIIIQVLTRIWPFAAVRSLDPMLFWLEHIVYTSKCLNYQNLCLYISFVWIYSLLRYLVANLQFVYPVLYDQKRQNRFIMLITNNQNGYCITAADLNPSFIYLCLF